MTSPRASRRLTRFPAAALLGLALLAGCGDGSDTSCGLDACTVTFDRGVEAGVSVLGVEAKLVSAQNDTVTVEVAGERVTLMVGGAATDVAGLQVSLQSVDAEQIAIRISR